MRVMMVRFLVGVCGLTLSGIRRSLRFDLVSCQCSNSLTHLGRRLDALFHTQNNRRLRQDH